MAEQVKAGSGQERDVSRQLFLFGCVRLENICNSKWRFVKCVIRKKSVMAYLKSVILRKWVGVI